MFQHTTTSAAQQIEQQTEAGTDRTAVRQIVEKTTTIKKIKIRIFSAVSLALALLNSPRTTELELPL